MGSIKFNTNRTKIDLTGVTETESSTLSGKGKQTAVLPTYKPNFKDVNLTTIQAQARTPVFKSVTTPRKYTTPTKKPKIELPKYTPFTNEEVGLLQHQTRLPMALPKSNLTSKAATNTEYALKSNPTAYGFAENFSPLATKKQLERQIGEPIDTTGSEDTLAYKVGAGAGMMGQYMITGGVAHPAVRAGIAKLIPSLAKNIGERTVKGVASTVGASALADILTGVPINTVQAIKESTVGEEVNWNQFAKSFAVNTAIDVVFGGLIEGGLVLKSGKKIKTVGDLKTVTPEESQEFMTHIERLAYESNVRKGKIIPQNDTLYGNAFTQPTGELPAPKIEYEDVVVDKIVQKKQKYIDEVYKNQYNDIDSIKKQLSKYYTNEDGGASDVAAQAIADLKKAENSISNATGKMDWNTRTKKTNSLRSDFEGQGKIIGKAFSDELIDTGRVNLAGIKFKSVDDLAAISHVYRDPRFETFRIIYTKGDEVVDIDAVSSRIPSSTRAFITDMPTGIKKMNEKMQRINADGYYLLHNHPSGSVKPSQADINMTSRLLTEVKGFRSHIIINSNKFTEVFKNSPSTLGSREDVALNLGRDILTEQSKPHPMIGSSIDSADTFAKIAKQMQLDSPNQSIIFFANGKGEIKAIMEVDNRFMNKNPIEFKNFVKNRAIDNGGTASFIQLGENANEKIAKEFVENGIFIDAIKKDGTSVRTQGVVDKTRPDDWMGINVKNVVFKAKTAKTKIDPMHNKLKKVNVVEKVVERRQKQFEPYVNNRANREVPRTITPNEFVETDIAPKSMKRLEPNTAQMPTREPVSTVEPVKAAKPPLTPKTEKVISNTVKTDNPYLNTITNVTEKTKAEKRLGENITFVNNKGNLTKATRKEYIEDMAMIDGSQIKTTQKLRTNGGKTFEVNEYRVYKTPNSKEPIKISKYEKDYFDFAKKNQDNVVQSVTQSDKSVQEVMKGMSDDIKAEYSMFENGFEGKAGNGIGLGKFVDKASDSHVGRSNDIERNAEYAWGKDTEAHKTWTEKFSKPFAESKRRNVDGFDSEMKGMEKIVIEDLKIKKNSPESAAVQWIGEGKRVIKEGKGLRKSLKEVDYTLDELKKDFNYVTSNGKKAWENIVEADTYFRSRYNRYVGEINEALKKIYPNVEKEVAKIEAKIAKLTDPTEITKLQARIKKETDPVKLKALESKLKNLKDPKYIEKKIGDYRWEINQATNNKRLYPQKNYYRHIKEMKDSLFTNIDNIKHSATDLEPATKPNSKFSSILQSRKHGLDYKADAISGFEDYILQAEYKINIEPNIPTLRGIVKELRAASGETGNAKRFITSVEDLANELAGKSNPIDKIPNLLLMSEDRGKAFTKITTKIMNRIKANAVLGNVGTMIVQPANFNNVVAYAKNPLDVADGMILATKALAGDKNAKAILAKSTALAERYMRRDLRRIDTGAVKKLENTTVWLLEALDKAVADSAFITFYKQGIKKGLKESDAIFQADKLVKKSIGGRGIGEMPISQNAQLTKNLVPFTVEVRNAVNVYKEMLFDMTKGVKTGDKALMASGALGLTEIMAVSYLMNEMYEKVLGRRITIDYIDSTKEALSGEDKTPQEKMVDLMYSTLGETLSGLPAGQYIAGLAQSATDLDSYELKAMFGDADPTRFGTGAMLATTFGKPIAQAIRGQKVDVITPALSVLPKFGGRQIDRTLEGAKSMGLLPNNGKMQDFPASYSATDKLRFTLDKTPENYVKALTTGIWSTDEGKNYIKQERVPLGSNQQAAVVSLGGTTESEEFVRSFPKTGVDAQREAIFNSNFTPAQKVMIDRTLIDSPVETQYRTKTDYEFSLLSDTKKQKYLPVAAANLKINKRVYMDFLSNVDLNKDGTIKQDETKAYLDGITSLTEEQKAVLWKSVNSGWSTKKNPYL